MSRYCKYARYEKTRVPKHWQDWTWEVVMDTYVHLATFSVRLKEIIGWEGLRLLSGDIDLNTLHILWMVDSVPG